MMSDETVELLRDVGFDPERNVLTQRQAEVLALREQNYSQREIADQLGTSRANISSVESSARQNVENARETVALAESLAAPVRLRIEPETDIYTIPPLVYEACDETRTKVAHSSAEIVRMIRETVPLAIADDQTTLPIVLSVGTDGQVTIRRPALD